MNTRCLLLVNEIIKKGDAGAALAYIVGRLSSLPKIKNPSVMRTLGSDEMVKEGDSKVSQLQEGYLDGLLHSASFIAGVRNQTQDMRQQGRVYQ